MKLFKLIYIVLVSGLFSACASGPKYADVASTFPTLEADKGRIYFYRSGSMMGAAIQPSITLNGNIIGTSKPGGFFFVDANPGDQVVATSTEVEKKLTFLLDVGQVRYVKTKIGFGIIAGRVYPELVDNNIGEQEVKETSYIGAPLTD
ncbi:MAG: DUF2846 domain-containing protein [Candidatus Thiodiazotropha sp. (ex Codakia rugifera)]|nr:DUF2846 domain-containing protein [Candidatus Thiodiazotropha sp. (ex Codakia rugifera)]